VSLEQEPQPESQAEPELPSQSRSEPEPWSESKPQSEARSAAEPMPATEDAQPGTADSDVVRRQMDELEDIERRALAEHAERYDHLHAELQAALSDIDGVAES
jgi:hypothetical protein